jgi:serine protease Do
MSFSRRFLFVFCLALCVCGQALAQSRNLPDFVDLVDQQGPAVVNVSTTQHVRLNQQFPFDEQDPMFEFFRRFVPRQQGGGRIAESRSLGSGFIVSNDGYILTNAHVVDAADEITVRLTDKREFKGRVIGADKRSDVALLKIEASGLPVVRLGNPEELRVGEWVVAIGSPFGFDNSVTAGIVSAKGRLLPQENFVPFIQTDVAINPGNSGGPLFNMKGEVVGINSQIYSRSGGYMGLSFAIPIDVAMEVQAQLRATGYVSRGRLGIAIQEVTRELAESFGLAQPGGALVSAVEEGGPADQAGIAAGDVITRIDGKPVTTASDLPRLVAPLRPGMRSTMRVWRQGASHDLTVTVGEMVDDKPATKPVARAPEPSANRLGLVLRELTPAQRRSLHSGGGLLVEAIRGNAARTDLQPGDVVLALINRGVTNELKSIDQFNKALAQLAKGANVTLLVRRGEQQTFVTIKGVND